MEWFRLSTKLPRDPKWMQLSAKAKVGFIEWIAYAAEQETDGIVYAGGRAPKWVDELLSQGLVVRVTDGYEIAAYLKWNPSKDDLAAKREAARERQSRRRHAVTPPVTTQEVRSTEVEVEREVEEPTTRSKTADAATRQPSHDHAYLVSKINERWPEGGNLSMGAVQRFIVRYGYAETDSALRALHGFPPEEAVRSPYAYVEAILKGDS